MREVGESYRSYSGGDRFDAIVVGSGIGGLSVAALLAKHADWKVLVLERHTVAGGFTHVFRRPGYEWDVGVHYIGRVGSPEGDVRVAFDHLTEGRLRWNPMPEVYDRVKIDGRSYAFPAGKERFREAMKGYFPSESAAIDKYLTTIQAAMRGRDHYLAEQAIPPAAALVAGPAMRARFLRYANRTTADVIGSLTQNRELAGVLTGQWGNYGLPPGRSSFGIHAIIVDHYLEGAGFPIGGASEIAFTIAPTIESRGGKIVVSAEVSGILLDAAGHAIGVRMADGREFHSKIVISDAGARNTFGRLLPASVAPEAHEALARIPPSMSHLCLYVGIRREPGEPEFPGANLWVFPGPDHDANVARFNADPEQPFPLQFISFPSAKDPTFEQRYPGRSTIEIVVPVPYDWFARWSDTRWKRRGPEYDAFKAKFSERLLRELELHVPGVKGRVERSELSTPLTTAHFANQPTGEVYGLSPTPERFESRAIGARTPVKNLFLTGQDACVLGVSGALFGGVIAASAILGRNLMSAVAKPS